MTGSPPRVRGKGVVDVLVSEPLGITPAYAGKRGSGSLPRSCRRDHPRVCGEKISQTRRNLPLGGSPPRVRGKALLEKLLFRLCRITPARAGKRSRGPCFPAPGQDHPRACGEKQALALADIYEGGSPPRVRGKDCKYPWFQWRAGITPARAGKSSRYGLRDGPFWDHPRACGEKADKEVNC